MSTAAPADTNQPASSQTPFESAWTQWHEAHESLRRDPHGFLAVTDLHWITTEAAALAGAPGTWRLADDAVHVTLGAGESLLRDGVELNTAENLNAEGELVFGPIEERDGIDLGHGNSVLELAKRGGEYILRPRNPSNALLRNYQGTPAFARTESLVLAAQYVPFRQPRETIVGAAVEGISHVYQAPGKVTFKLDGAELALTAFNGSAPGTFQVLFTDETSGISTYAANRTLTFTAPEKGGATTLDFNRAVNLPCAYTDLATCPLPPAENHLPVAITAGEKIPFEREAAQ